MKTALASAQIQMDILKPDMNAERDRLHEDNGRLKDLNSELRLRGRAEVDSFRKEIERLAEGMKAELEAAEEAHAVALRERDSLQRVSLRNRPSQEIQL